MRFHLACGMLCLLLLCSCATENPKRFELPEDVAMNKAAGRGDWIFVTLHLEDGTPLLCVLDTGTFGLILDNSFEPKLGRCLWIQKIHPTFGITWLRLHRAPKLCLGNTPLHTSGWVWTADLSGVTRGFEQDVHTNRPIMGILGMSCLKYYCIQLDFAADKLRFLNGLHANKQEWGEAFHLNTHFGNCSIGQDIVGVKGSGSIIDTGCDFDCYLTPKLFNQWTNRAVALPKGQPRYPNAVLGGETYTNVCLTGPNAILGNGIGLTFLSRNLVTFDFPNHTMYLKKISTGPFMDEQTRSVAKFLSGLRASNKLPGWSKNEQGSFSYCSYLLSGVFDIVKNGDSTTYHYVVTRNPVDGAWKLQTAWQTNADGKMIKEY